MRIRIQLGIPLIRLNQWLEQLRTLSDMQIRIWLGIPHIRLNQWLEQLRTLSDMWIRIRLGIPHIRLSQWLEQLRESPRVSISLGMFFKILGSVIPPVYKPSGRPGSILRFRSINDRTLLSSRTHGRQVMDDSNTASPRTFKVQSERSVGRALRIAWHGMS